MFRSSNQSQFNQTHNQLRTAVGSHNGRRRLDVGASETPVSKKKKVKVNYCMLQKNKLLKVKCKDDVPIFMIFNQALYNGRMT